ncbi:hypothetical protein [Photobacterium alginatilyticum]|uniref:Uncharacterized protein n=1 Tax=Photobacterium alginatilyticum TaxID=1775171 RepID=A0ABW9YLN7_9GAMM|nr:hypothetical protein [Photobacterium alginatilyticum]NBI54123.1 hypothetical protein [Photobacterium alginatilyticum]
MKKVVCLLLAIVPNICHAEVSDKIPSYGNLWITSIVIGLVFLLISYKVRFINYFSLIVALFMAFGIYDMYAEPSFRSAVIDEKGEGYFYHGFFSSFLIFVLSIIGSWLRHFKAKR